MAIALGLCSANLNMCQVETSPEAELLWSGCSWDLCLVLVVGLTNILYSVLQCGVYSICSDMKQLPHLKPEVAAAVLECLCKLTSNPQGQRALLKM